MSGEEYAVILVLSTSHAVRIEKMLAQQGIACIIDAHELSGNRKTHRFT